MKGFYGKPLITLEELFDMPKKHDDRGIILTSSCLAGVIPQNIMNEDYSKAEDHALLMKEEFMDNFYLEIQAHELEEQRLVNRGLIDIHKKTKIPLCIGTDAHYPDTSYSRSHEIFLLIQGEEKVEDIGKKIWRITYETNKGEIRRKKINFGEELYGLKIEDINVGDHIHKKKGRMDKDGKWELKINKKELVNKVWMIESADLSFKTVEQLHVHIDKFEELREIKDHMLNSNYEIYDKIEYIKPNSDLKLPIFDNDYKQLVEMCLNGMKEKNLTSKEYTDRLKIELNTIKNGGLSSYFLILKDIIDYAKSDEIPMAVGRGSSGASLVVYILGITRLDPVKWNFNFERFLNEKKIGENLIKYRIELDDGREIEFGENDLVKLKNGESKKAKNLHKDDEIDV
jgi:DNA polymerase-3 subunit alpha